MTLPLSRSSLYVDLKRVSIVSHNDELISTQLYSICVFLSKSLFLKNSIIETAKAPVPGPISIIFILFISICITFI